MPAFSLRFTESASISFFTALCFTVQAISSCRASKNIPKSIVAKKKKYDGFVFLPKPPTALGLSLPYKRLWEENFEVFVVSFSSCGTELGASPTSVGAYGRSLGCDLDRGLRAWVGAEGEVQVGPCGGAQGGAYGWAKVGGKVGAKIRGKIGAKVGASGGA